MKYNAVMILGRNTFLALPLENHDDPAAEVEKDAEQVAARLGAEFLYLEEVEE